MTPHEQRLSSVRVKLADRLPTAKDANRREQVWYYIDGKRIPGYWQNGAWHRNRDPSIEWEPRA